MITAIKQDTVTVATMVILVGIVITNVRQTVEKYADKIQELATSVVMMDFGIKIVTKTVVTGVTARVNNLAVIAGHVNLALEG